MLKLQLTAILSICLLLPYTSFAVETAVGNGTYDVTADVPDGDWDSGANRTTWNNTENSHPGTAGNLETALSAKCSSKDEIGDDFEEKAEGETIDNGECKWEKVRTCH